MPDEPARPLVAPGDVPYLAALGAAPGIGVARTEALLSRFGSAERAWNAPAEALRAAVGDEAATALAATRRAASVARLWSAIEASGARVVVRGDAGYPPLLAEIPRAPILLYVEGEVRHLAHPGVAVVGTRRATDYGRRMADAVARDLVAAGLAVVSGLALGIDGAAHAAALDGGGVTVAVLGCGLDVAYPAGSERLRDAIAARGALVSEYPPGTEPLPGRFPARNRIVSGLTLATVVVEAGERSGALVTAALAADQGRDVYAVPGPIDRPQSRGANRLIADGAGVVLSGAELASAIAAERALDRAAARVALPADPVEAALRDRLDDAPRHADAIGREAGLAAPDVARGLALLELKGLARHVGGMNWVASDGRSGG